MHTRSRSSRVSGRHETVGRHGTTRVDCPRNKDTWPNGNALPSIAIPCLPRMEATEHLFEELPLSTYPSGTTMEPLAYEMEPGAHLGRAAPWTQALVLFPRREPPRMAVTRDIGVSFREACDRGYLRPYDPHRVPDA